MKLAQKIRVTATLSRECTTQREWSRHGSRKTVTGIASHRSDAWLHLLLSSSFLPCHRRAVSDGHGDLHARNQDSGSECMRVIRCLVLLSPFSYSSHSVSIVTRHITYRHHVSKARALRSDSRRHTTPSPHGAWSGRVSCRSCASLEVLLLPLTSCRLSSSLPLTFGLYFPCVSLALTEPALTIPPSVLVALQPPPVTKACLP